MYIFNEVCIGFPRRFGFIGFRPPLFWFPFSSFPLHTLLFSSFLSCPPVFMFCYLILSFVCAHIGPGLSVYVHIYLHFKHRFQVAQVLTTRWGSSVVGVHLFHINHLHLCPVPSSFSCLHPFVFAARALTLPSQPLILFAFPRQGVCVTFGVTRFLLECVFLRFCI